MIITNIEPKTDVKGKDYLLVTADGTKMGCWETKIFSTLKTAYANGTPIDLTTKVNGKYTQIVGIGGGAGATSHHQNSSHSTPPSPAPYVNGQEIGMCINNACELLGRQLMPDGKLPTQEDILALAITIWKATKALTIKTTEKPINPPITEEQDEIPYY